MNRREVQAAIAAAFADGLERRTLQSILTAANFQPQLLSVPAGTRRILVLPDPDPPPPPALPDVEPPASLNVSYEDGESSWAHEGRIRYVATALRGGVESLPSDSDWGNPEATNVNVVRWYESPSEGVTGYRIYRTEPERNDYRLLLELAEPEVDEDRFIWRDDGSVKRGTATPPEAPLPWNQIGGIKLAGPRPPNGYDLLLEREHPPDRWYEDGSEEHEVEPGGADLEFDHPDAQMWLRLWPFSDAPDGALIRNSTIEGMCIDPGGMFTPEVSMITAPMACRLIYEDGFWRVGARMYA